MGGGKVDSRHEPQPHDSRQQPRGREGDQADSSSSTAAESPSERPRQRRRMSDFDGEEAASLEDNVEGECVERRMGGGPTGEQKHREQGPGETEARTAPKRRRITFKSGPIDGVATVETDAEAVLVTQGAATGMRRHTRHYLCSKSQGREGGQGGCHSRCCQ